MVTSDERERLLLVAEPYIRHFAMGHNPPQPLDREDLYQVGMLAAWRVSEDWHDTTTAYRNAAITTARSRMIDEIRRHRWAKRRGGKHSEHVPPVTLEQSVSDPAHADATIGDTIEEPRRPELVVDALDTLRHMDERHRRMVVMRGLGYTLREVGDMYGVSQSRVSQIVNYGR